MYSTNTSLLVGDEAHLAEEVFRDHKSLRYSAFGTKLKPGRIEPQAAKEFLLRQLKKYTEEEREAAKIDNEEDLEDVEEAKLPDKDKRRIRINRLYRGIEILNSSRVGNYVTIIEPKRSNLHIIPLKGYWPSVHGLYLSATLLNPLVTEPFGNTAYIRLSSTFPVENRPVFSMAAARLSAKADPSEWAKLYQTIDSIIDANPNSQGVIHTTSYKMAEEVLTNSSHSGIMVTHGPGERDQAIKTFKERGARILVSPAVAEGVDFPGDECRFQIIPKVPFPDSRDITSSAIFDATPGLTEVTVARKIVQMAGRGVRSETDSCVTFILDTNFRWFYSKNSGLFPSWFRDGITYI